jgi:hypothetical protein
MFGEPDPKVNGKGVTDPNLDAELGAAVSGVIAGGALEDAPNKD